ncbi:MAG: transposase [Gemmatimonadetes bacterium]|nr:transposase [Gemmatimonadota bacterium]
MAFEEKTRMPLSLEQAGDHAPVPADALRAMVATLVQETMQTEFNQFIGAAPYERTEERQGRRKDGVAVVPAVLLGP